MSRRQDVVGSLPKAFIGVAFLNFLVGASLGGWMSSQPGLWSLVGPIHGEINPFGWLTMLIYGMTYAMLGISAGLRPPKAWVGWLHLAFSELAIGFVTCAHLTDKMAWLDIGLIAQFAAPLLFLVNILSAVFSARKKRRASQPESLEDIGELALLRRDPAFQSTDNVAQRGTDVSLMLFVAGALWMLICALTHRDSVEALSFPSGALYLVYYGWIAGTILAVSLHLFPRFLQGSKFSATSASMAQIIWGLAILVGSVGSAFGMSTIATTAFRVLGASLIWSSLVYLKALIASERGQASQSLRLSTPSMVAWLASWTFCLILGGGLIFGLDPFSLVALHLLFLAFATNLVYGVGYTLFPLLLHRTLPSRTLAIAQVCVAVVGVIFMLWSFLGMQFPIIGQNQEFTLLGIGGSLAAAGAIVFLFQWAFAKPK